MEVIKLVVDAPYVDIAPISDVQLGNFAFDEKLFEEYLTNVPPGAYYIGVGDYVDGVSPSNRKLLNSLRAKKELYDVVWDDLEADAERHQEDFLRHVDHTVGKWIALLDGHHYWTFDDNTTTDEHLAEALDSTFVEGDLILEVLYGAGNGITKRVHAWHGQGNAATPAGVYNKMVRKSWVDADLYLMGHTHRKFAIPGPPQVDQIDPLSDAGWHQRETWYINTGSYLRGYMRGRPTYVEQGGLPPTHLGGAYIRFDERGKIRIAL